MKAKQLRARFWMCLLVTLLSAIAALGATQQESSEPITFEASGERPAVVEPKSAEELFAIYARADETWDATVTRLYAADARIRHTRRYANGQVRALTIPVQQWKELIVQTMPLAEAAGDTSTYSNIRYEPAGERVRIRATRHAGLKNYDSPFELLVGPNADGVWRIYEEITESRP